VGAEDVLDLMQDLSQAIRGADRGRPLASHCLGSPLPHDEPSHACGTALPNWADVVGYEEGESRVHNLLRFGYPRFVYTPAVKHLMEHLPAMLGLAAGMAVMPMPSARAALRLHKFLQLEGGAAAASVALHDLQSRGVCAVSYPSALAPQAKVFWQHTGDYVSSRLATRVLQDLTTDAGDLPAPNVAHAGSAVDGAKALLRRRIGQLVNSDAADVSLFGTGMGAMSGMCRAVQHATTMGRTGKFVVFGFPYLDTLKQLQHRHLGPGAHFVRQNDFAALDAILQKESIAGLVLEYPSNPLLSTSDMARVRQRADEHGFPVIVDDSIGAYNVDVLRPGGADVLVTSLTKSFSGRGNVMGGALVLNRTSAHYTRLRKAIAMGHEEELLFAEDAEVLLSNSMDFEYRTDRTNRSADALAEFLVAHPAVARVDYPKYVTPDYYAAFMRDGQSGHGGLMSVILKDVGKAPAVYDALQVREAGTP